MTAARKEGPTAASRVAAGIGTALVLLLVAGLAWDALGERRPPSLVATVVAGEARRAGAALAVPVDVANEGDLAAVAIVVEVAAGEAASETVVDALAGGETVRLVVLLEGATAEPVRARVVSYREP